MSLGCRLGNGGGRDVPLTSSRRKPGPITTGSNCLGKAVNHRFKTTSAAAYGSRLSPGRRGDRYESAFSRHVFARGFPIRCPSPEERAQGMPGARCTRGLVCQKCALRRTRAYRAAEAVRHPLRNGFTAYFVLSPVERACCHRHLRKTSTSLTPASRRQDHTTSPYALAFSS